MTVTVYVWETRANIFKAGFDFNVEDHGHASAEVLGEYMSFWPAADDYGTRPKKWAVDTRTPYYPDDYEEDCQTIGRYADKRVYIYNLDEYVMREYCEQVILSGTKFIFMESNCSTIIGRMLRRGWDASSQHLSSSTRSAVLSHAQRGDNYYWEPEDVLNFAQAIKGAIG